MIPSPTMPTVLSMRLFPSCRIRLTGGARRALISDRTINNHQLASAGQAAFVAMRKNEEGLAASLIWIGGIPKSRNRRDSEERQNGGRRSQTKRKPVLRTGSGRPCPCRHGCPGQGAHSATERPRYPD